MQTISRSAFCLILASSAALAQLRVPTSGFIADEQNNSIRPVLGLPGAWTLGPVLDLGQGVSVAKFAPNGNFAMVVRKPVEGDAQPGTLVLLSPGSDSSRIISVSNQAADSIVLNDSETSALLYFRTEQKIQWVRGLPDQPSVVQTVSTADAPGSLSALALNKRGDAAFFAVAQDGVGMLFRISPNGAPQMVGPVLTSSVVFAANDSDAFVADSATGQILIAGEQSLLPIADVRQTLGAPAVLQTLDSTKLLIASGLTNKIGCLDTGSGILTETSVPIAALKMERMGVKGMFSLGAAPDMGPTYVLDATTVDGFTCSPSVLFIPGSVKSE